MKLIAIVLLMTILLSRLAFAAESVEGIARVVDGDTIAIEDQRIRLWGIDAPELVQRCREDGVEYPCGLDASHALSKRIGLRPVTCTRRDTDRYGRMVAVCTVEGVDISRWMVQTRPGNRFQKILARLCHRRRRRQSREGRDMGG